MKQGLHLKDDYWSLIHDILPGLHFDFSIFVIKTHAILAGLWRIVN